MKRVRVRIDGSVQGVGFRFETRERARSRGVSGWVRNQPDGTVEAVFEGDPDAVDSIVEWCRRGPRGAEVRALEVSVEPALGEPGFSIR